MTDLIDLTIRDLGYRYEAVVKNSNHRLHRAKPLDFDTATMAVTDVINSYQPVECCEIVMPKDRLDEFLESQESYLTQRERNERELRERNPALKNAWEQYQLILALVK